MLADGAAFRLIDSLLEVGLEGATREHLVRKAKVSVTTFYKAINSLLKAGLVKESGNRFYFPLEHPYNFHFKVWRDFDRLQDLKERTRSAVYGVLEDARTKLGHDLVCLWLVGSAALGELRDDSDLDFLALLGPQENAYHPPEGPREVQWVPMDEEHFLGKLREGDEFVANALRYGLLLHDTGRAQRFYTIPIAPPGRSVLKDKTLTIESFRSRFFRSFEDDDLEEARNMLASLAQSMIRLILGRLKETPAGKPDILSLLTIYFGTKMAKDFRAAISLECSVDKKELVLLHRRISDYYSYYMDDAEHLEGMADALLRGQSAGFERAANTALKAILEESYQAESSSQQWETDGVISLAKHPDFVVEMKSLAGPVSTIHITKVVELVADHQERTNTPSRGLLLVNSLRDVPVLERTPVDSRVLSTAQKTGVDIVTSATLLRALHVLHLEKNPKQALRLLSLKQLKHNGEELRDELVEINDRIERTLRQIVAARGWLDQGKSIFAPSLGGTLEKLYHKSSQPLSRSLVNTVEKFMAALTKSTPTKAELVDGINNGLEILRTLRDFPRGTYTVVDVQLPIYEDSEGAVLREDVSGVLIEVTGSDTHRQQIFPTKEAYELGDQLSWEWNAQRGWDESWYRDHDGRVHYAWLSSLEFVGRPLRSL